MTKTPPAGLIDWQGRPWIGRADQAAHPNSRFTAPMANNPSASPRRERPAGRADLRDHLRRPAHARLSPLVYQAFNWEHGVYVGADHGLRDDRRGHRRGRALRRDPMAMLPFCGYNMGDYFQHWLDMRQAASPHPPKIFHVNWFRKDAERQFLWPGFGDNMRVLLWMIDRVEGQGKAQETPIGLLPAPDALNLEGLDVAPETMRELLRVDRAAWIAETEALTRAVHADRRPSSARVGGGATGAAKAARE